MSAAGPLPLRPDLKIPTGELPNTNVCGYVVYVYVVSKMLQNKHKWYKWARTNE